MPGDTFPVGFTRGLLPGLQESKLGLLPALQDYVTFIYTQHARHVVEVNLGSLGETLISFKEASTILNQIYDLATNPNVEVDRTGVPTTTNGNTNIFDAAVASLFTDSPTLYDQLGDFLTNVPASAVPGMSKARIQSVYDDLSTFNGSRTDANWKAWYSSSSFQHDLTNALTTVGSLNSLAQAKLREFMFIYETFVKGASAILSGVGQSVENIAINVRQN